MIDEIFLKNIYEDSLEKELFSRDEKLILSFSGGPDSVFLLDFLLKFIPSENLILIYFDHGLRDNDTLKLERKFVLETGCKYSLKTLLKKIPVKKYSEKYRVSLETAGRNLRYILLCHYAKMFGVSKILTAHHLDDVCETFFLRAIRGSGTNLGSISDNMVLTENISVVRPLLKISKSEILDYLNSENISYVLDQTNNDNDFSRNRLRNVLFPVIELINPSYRQNIDQLLFYLKEQNLYLDSLVQSILDEVVICNGTVSLPLKCLKKNDPFLQNRVIFKMLELLKLKIIQGNNVFSLKENKLELSDFEIRSSHVHSIYKQIKNDLISSVVKDREHVVSLPCGYVCSIKSQNLVLHKNEKKEPVSFFYKIDKIPCDIVLDRIRKRIEFSIIENNLDSYVSSSNVAYVDYEKLVIDDIYIRNRCSGDKFVPYGSLFNKKIKSYFIDLKIIKEERNEVPLFFSQNRLVWVIGYQTSENFKVTLDTQKILRIELSDITNT
jgi:tRNA(Ile)-lysidine synthase